MCTKVRKGNAGTMANPIVDRNRDQRVVIRCNRDTHTRWRVNLADSNLDGESYLNMLMDSYRTTHPGTMKPMPGQTFGQMLAGAPR